MSPDRRLLDRYYTSPEVAEACVSTLTLPSLGLVLEPHAGGGAFTLALKKRMGRIWANDIDPNAKGLEMVPIGKRRVGDFLQWEPAKAPKFDWIIGNPPYKGAELQVRHAIKMLKPGGSCAFLLRLGFLSSKKRAKLYTEHRPHVVHVLTRRPSFTGGGTDLYDYAFIVWKKGHKGPTRLEWLSW